MGKGNPCFALWRLEVLLAVLLLIIFVIKAGAVESQISSSYSIEQLTDMYVELTFKSEGHGGAQDISHLKKWSFATPVKILTFPRDSVFDQGERYKDIIGLTVEVASQIEAPIDLHFADAFDARRMTELANSKKAIQASSIAESISVYIGNRVEIDELVIKLSKNIIPEAKNIGRTYSEASDRTGLPLCFGIAAPNVSNQNVLVRGWIFLEDSSELESCLWEELMQAFGLFNDFPFGTFSMFNDDMVYMRPTDLDWLLWRAHFDRRLVAGMTEDEVRAILPEVFSELIEK